jgi:endonuclease-3
MPPKRAPFPIETVLETIRETVRQWKTPIVTVIACRRDPFLVLVSTILSLRTKDETTDAASRRLFRLARTPRGLLRLSEDRIARTIFPVGFYRTKARTLREICGVLIDRHGGRVPDELDALLELKGVGRKTANLVLTLGFGKPGICVDTHVHRIANRWGYVRTRTPDETEMALRRRLPACYWIPINDWLVAYGQNLCTPVSPFCSRCPVALHCARRGVGRTR